MCFGCHNIPGYKTAFPSVYSVPKLDGQHAAYIVSALKAYKSGARTHPSMRAIAASYAAVCANALRASCRAMRR